MLNTCIQTVLTELNTYIKTRTNSSEDQVAYFTYTDFQSTDKDEMLAYENKIIMSLVDIKQEDNNHNPTKYIQQGNKYVVRNIPMNFYIYILFAAHFKSENALEGLRYLSYVIAFFQFKNHFTSKNTPTLQAADLEEFSTFLMKLDYQEKSALWGSLHVAYMPSVLYKVGMIPIADTPEVWPEVPAVNEFVHPS